MAKTTFETIRNCPDCQAKPGQPHERGCDVERCSTCGGQRLQCRCAGHDVRFARWTGLWPGEPECFALGLTLADGGADLNTFYRKGLSKTFFVKPAKK